MSAGLLKHDFVTVFFMFGIRIYLEYIDCFMYNTHSGTTSHISLMCHKEAIQQDFFNYYEEEVTYFITAAIVSMQFQVPLSTFM